MKRGILFLFVLNMVIFGSDIKEVKATAEKILGGTVDGKEAHLQSGMRYLATHHSVQTKAGEIQAPMITEALNAFLDGARAGDDKSAAMGIALLHHYYPFSRETRPKASLVFGQVLMNKGSCLGSVEYFGALAETEYWARIKNYSQKATESCSSGPKWAKAYIGRQIAQAKIITSRGGEKR